MVFVNTFFKKIKYFFQACQTRIFTGFLPFSFSAFKRILLLFMFCTDLFHHFPDRIKRLLIHIRDPLQLFYFACNLLKRKPCPSHPVPDMDIT